jgi:hypothetical protein
MMQNRHLPQQTLELFETKKKSYHHFSMLVPNIFVESCLCHSGGSIAGRSYEKWILQIVVSMKFKKDQKSSVSSFSIKGCEQSSRLKEPHQSRVFRIMEVCLAAKDGKRNASEDSL